MFGGGDQIIGVNSAARQLFDWAPLSIGTDIDVFLKRFPVLRKIAPGSGASQTEMVLRAGRSYRKVLACRMPLRYPTGEICAELYTFHVLKTHVVKPENAAMSIAPKGMSGTRGGRTGAVQKTMCCSCKRVRDKEGRWMTVEKYIQSFLNVQFSHGLCPDCMRKLYDEENSNAFSSADEARGPRRRLDS